MSVPLDSSFAHRREQAVLCDLLATREIGLAAVWRDLSLGAQRVFDTFFTNERCYVILERRTTHCLAPSRMDSQQLQRIMSGECQNSIAVESDESPSTVGSRARQALLAIGVDAKPSRVHPLLMLAAASARTTGGDEARGARSSQLEPGHQLSTLSIQRPELGLVGVLPRAEVAIASYLVEGLCYEEMAARRGTKIRTIANQIASLFHRFRVSGRNELVLRLLTDRSLSQESVAGAPVPANARLSAPVAPAC